MQLTSVTKAAPSKRVPSEPKGTPLTAGALSQLSAEQLDAAFRSGTVGEIPDGDADGTALVWPGSAIEPLLERAVRAVAWQGKIVNASTRLLKNKILPIGLPAIAADLYWDRSWFDGAECIVLDYSKRSFVARWVRDELRLVGPGLYLGLVFVRRRRLLYFTLQFPTQQPVAVEAPTWPTKRR
jgi:hypothetical protein